MATTSAIEWTDATWTPLRARHRDTGRVGTICVHKSAGCERCYSEKFQSWVGVRAPFTPSGLKAVEPFLDEKILAQPLSWRAPKRIFVCSQTDLFGEWWHDGWIDRVFAVMMLAEQHTFQILTKRPDRMLAYLSAAGLEDRIAALASEPSEEDGVPEADYPGWPLPNVWLGVSVENQAAADERIPLLLQTPAAVRFLSVEPLLGPIVLDKGPGEYLRCPDCGYTKLDVAEQMDHRLCKGPGPGIDWIIVGGESGPGARPCDLAWIRSVVQQAKAAGTACFVKQLGARPYIASVAEEMKRAPWSFSLVDPDRAGGTLSLRDRKGGDPSEWPDDLRVREFPRG